MPADVVLVDTGPLVALFDSSDREHDACEAELGRLARARLVTTMAVLTEATFLLSFAKAAQRAVLDFVAAGAIELPELGQADVGRAATLMAKYHDLPMDFADATLVVLAERLGTTRVFTLDRRDFRMYRSGRKAFRIIPSA
jgi:predicted nucleic acid-binding protein